MRQAVPGTIGGSTVLIARFAAGDSAAARVGVADGGSVTELAGLDSMAGLWRLERSELQDRLSEASGPEWPADAVRLLPPVDAGTEVWACGVTYRISQDARIEESERAASVYEQVYDAERPELFFKSAAWRVVGDGEPVAIRADSQIDVPEPELAVVVNTAGEVVGYTVCNDVSSRTIEGENPLYLPQAKTYLGACAVGPAIRPAWEMPDPYALTVAMTISRDGQAVWQGTASTGQLHRRIDELVSFLLRADRFPDGAILSTGTCLVPPAPFSLAAGDLVRIEIEQVGTLANPVVDSVADMGWLVDSRADVRARPSVSRRAAMR
jgi:2-dehydro-3-deoxy-D-arabinonate dehydratase